MKLQSLQTLEGERGEREREREREGVFVFRILGFSRSKEKRENDKSFLQFAQIPLFQFQQKVSSPDLGVRIL